MTVFFNFFKKSATKHQLAYRYGARKGNLTFFQNHSLNRGFHSLYGVKEEKILKKCRKIELSGQCYVKEERKFLIWLINRCLKYSVVLKRKSIFPQNYCQFVFKCLVYVECWCEKKKIFSFST